ncbi:hypothetical protein AB4099_08300 [Bosea sp. 2KB_26]|uniref:hypothetical protein n=1 Tax=Bosea sp. 2KB_26 TaxID=3237475 RepID=UPI003F9132DB
MPVELTRQICRDDDGNHYTVIAWRPYPHRRSTSYTLDTGALVNYVDDHRFEIDRTGTIITRVPEQVEKAQRDRIRPGDLSDVRPGLALPEPNGPQLVAQAQAAPQRLPFPDRQPMRRPRFPSFDSLIWLAVIVLVLAFANLLAPAPNAHGAGFLAFLLHWP